MSAERYKISECELDVLAITGPEGTRYIDGEEIEARVIRQQSADIAELRAELNRERETNAVLRRDLAEPPPDIQELALKKCGHFEIVAKLRADLAAVVAERDEWKECAMSNLDERDQLRARLAEYENAPTVAVVWFARNKDGVACSGLDYTDLPPIGTELIARKVKK